MHLSYQRPESEVCCRRTFWRFISHPSTVETVYVSWLARPHKWQWRLNDIAWTAKGPLRMTSCQTVTTPPVPVSLAPQWKEVCKSLYCIILLCIHSCSEDATWHPSHWVPSALACNYVRIHLMLNGQLPFFLPKPFTGTLLYNVLNLQALPKLRRCSFAMA